MRHSIVSLALLLGIAGSIASAGPDRCDGTLTKVRRGRLVVRDLPRGRSVNLKAGQSYLARAPS
jgi:hypothetical protein